MNVKVYLTQFEDSFGYDLVILNEEATIQDYLDALNDFQEKTVAECKGCDNCCWERIPLTSIDVCTYLNNPNITMELPDTPSLLTSFVHKYCYVFAEGPAMDIMLKHQSNGACFFLDTNQKICTNHTARSLVCQTFICLPHSERAGKLRDTLLNVGEDELVRQYLLESEKLGTPVKVDEGTNPTLNLDDYPPTAYEGKKSYAEVKIRDVVSDELFGELRVENN